jgi:hypothetical protein
MPTGYSKNPGEIPGFVFLEWKMSDGAFQPSDIVSVRIGRRQTTEERCQTSQETAARLSAGGQFLHQSIRELHTFVKLLHTDPFVLPVGANVIHVRKHS